MKGATIAKVILIQKLLTDKTVALMLEGVISFIYVLIIGVANPLIIYTTVIKINPNMAVDFESKKIDMLMPKLMNIKKLFLENNPCNL